MKKIISYLLIILLFFVPLGLLFRFKLAANVYLIPQDIIVGPIALLVFFYLLQNKQLKKAKKIKFLLIFVLVGVISVFINMFFIPKYSLLTSLLYTTRYLIYTMLIFVPSIVGGVYRKWLFFSGSAIVFFGTVQYLFYKDLGNLSYLGWDNHLYRLFSTFLDPNFAGAFYVIFFFFLISFQKKAESNSAKLLYFLIFMMTFLSIFLSYSRTSFIMLVAGLAIFFVLLRKIKLLAFSFLVSIIIFLLVSDFSVEGLNPLRVASSKERLKSANEALAIFSKNSFLGVGFNGYRYAQTHYGYRSESGAAISNADAGTDNSYLFVLATTGIVGFIPFVLFYFQIIKRIKPVNISNISAISLLGSIFVGSLFLNILFYTPLLLWMNLILGEFVESKADK